MSDFSVVIPTYRRTRQLAACVKAFSRIDYPRDRFELIIVDDGSPESSEPVLLRWRDQLDVRFVRQVNAGPAAARNLGARYARFAHVAFIDDDCVPHPRWLHSLANVFTAAPDDLVGGHTVNALPHNPYSSASQEMVTYLCGYFDGRDGRTRLFTSNNMALRTDHFHAIGGFDTRFARAAGEDREFCDRWVAQGRRTTFARDAIVSHAHRLTLRSFWRQHYEYGRGAASFRRARAARDGAPVRLEPPFFYAGLLMMPFERGVSIGALNIAGLVVLAQAANAAGYVMSGREIRRIARQPRSMTHVASGSSAAAHREVAGDGVLAPGTPLPSNLRPPR